MSLRTALALSLLAISTAAASFAAHGMGSQDDPGPMVNDPNPATFQVYGLPAGPKSVKDESVQGGRALNVAVSGGGTPYAVGVNVPVNKPIKAGDQLTVMFYAKLQKAEPGVTSAKITAQVQLSSAPYTAIAGKPFEVPAQWTLFTVKAVADKDYPKGTLTAAFHINTGKQTIGLGPVAVFAKPK